ncbi:hypothetical protein [uncultured Tateyamaria sp.]|uniref:hypothetical protein n=1 Tax=uncultured Tateyamaria sp. TaxID=455651 RepID=UPI002634E8E7|nr:hypothetical protein [uncultured Tateyamaria sp.]
MTTDPAPAYPALPEVVTRFLGRSVLMYGIPFSYLVPDARMLPSESIRFFYVDPGWISTLVQGATSVGRPTPRDTPLDTFLRDQALRDALSEAMSVRESGEDEPQATDAKWPLTGFLMRSEVVAGWQGLEMRTYDDTGAEIAPLRIDRLAPDIMLCIFNGKVHSLTLKQPPEGMHFGLSPGSVPGEYFRLKLRNLNGTVTVTQSHGVLDNHSANAHAGVETRYTGDATWSGGSLNADQITALTSGFSATTMTWDYAVAKDQVAFVAGGTVTLSFAVTVRVPDMNPKKPPSVTQSVLKFTLTLPGGAPKIVLAGHPDNHSVERSIPPGEFFPTCFNTGIKAPMRAPAAGATRPTRVLRAARMAEDIRAKLKAHDQDVSIFTSAEFGVEMVESPGFVTFKSEKLT